MYSKVSPTSRLFAQNVSDSLILRVARNVVHACQSARDTCEATFTAQVRRDVFAHMRRGYLEDALLMLPSQFPGVTARSQRNTNRTARHSLVMSGIVRMTACAVDDRMNLPRWAFHRAEYTRSSSLHLFESNDIPPTEPLYAIIVYGPSSYHGPFPQFWGVGFPERAMTKWSDFIDLGGVLSLLRNPPIATQNAPASGLLRLRPENQTQGEET